MKRIKRVSLLTAVVLVMAVTLYGTQRYSTYEAEQEEVRKFQQLAFKGYSAINTGRDEEALKQYEAAVAIYDKDDASLSDLATLYRKKGRIKEARALYEKAYKVEQDKYKHLYNAALCDYLLEDYDSAVKKVMELMHQDKKRSKYYRLLAISHFANGEREKAMGAYAVLMQRKSYQNDELLKKVKSAYDALEVKPEPEELRFAYEDTDAVEELEDLMQRYVEEGYDIKALRTAQKILGIEEEHNGAHKMAAELFYRHDVMDEAGRHAEAVSVHDARSLEMLGGIQQRIGEHEKALESYERSYAMQPKTELLRAMAVCAFHAKRTKEMAEYLERLGEFDPQLAHRVVYALETKSGVTHTTWEKLEYLIKDDLLGLYCDLRGCHDA
ncbi:MAG: tetratricopeptide repeat protein [Campylobacterales bacterium]|nr:tetratricopeptide repeat protein [Campylobacterales bacterium]